MSIKYYANKVQETSISFGTGNFVLDGSPSGFRTFLSSIGSDNKFNYYIYRLDTNFEWEIGVGYIQVSGGLNILVREKVVSSSNANNLVSFTKGTKYVETIVSGDNSNSLVNTNLEIKSMSFTAPNVSATYIVDASSANVTVSLPSVTSTSDPVILGFMLDKTISSQYEQSNAILLVPSGSQTINGTGSYDVSFLKDYLQIASVPSQSGWVTLDPILESSYPYGNDGNIQFKSNSAFSGVNALYWDSVNEALLVGSTGNITSAHIILPGLVSSTTVFNEQSYANDFRVEGTGTTHMFFIDGSANKIGINSSNPTDVLTINSSGGNGLTIYNSGAAPSVVFSNTSQSGVTPSNIIGSIVFSGLNSNNSGVGYARIYSVIDSAVNNNENSSVHIESLNSGSNEDVAVFSADGVTLGFNNTNTDGVVIGSASSNEGNNVVLGSFHDVCADNSIVIGDTLTLSSGTYGGLIGTNHTASGNNIWVLGGSGVSATGSNMVYVALNDDTYLNLVNSGSLVYSTLSNNDINFIIHNSSILASGINENIIYKFVNSVGAEKTGLMLSSNITNVSSGNETSRYICKIMSTGTLANILDLSNNNLIIGSNSYSGNNIIYGLNNSIINSGNFIFGRDISVTGTNNIIFGKNITCSGLDNTIIGRNNDCLTSGNMGIVIVGNGNEIDEDYGIAIGIDNANSGLYSVSCGYLNGVHGDYSIGIGESNTVTANGSVAFGRSNNVSNTDLAATLFALGVGNLGVISNTGILFGYNNQLYGSGGFLVGSTLYSTGNNNLLVGNNSSSTGVANLIFGSSSSISGTNSTILGNSSKIVGDSNIILGSGINVTGTNNILISNNTSGSLSGTNNIRLFVNNNNYINVNDSGVIIKTTGNYTFDTNIIVSGYANIYGNLLTSGNCVVKSGISVGGTGDFASLISKTSIVASGTGTFNSLISNTSIIASGTGTFNNLIVKSTASISGIMTAPAINITGVSSVSSFSGIVATNSGVIFNKLTTPTGVGITPLSMPTGISQIHKIIYQNDANISSVNSRLRYEILATSGIPITPKYLTANDAEYQFLYPSGATDVYLPNGTGLYLGKKFTIANMHASNAITVYKSGSVSPLNILYAGYNFTVVHAGNNNWIKIVTDTLNT
jgi:hypothetical protein